jgi:NAD(P)-dependent dehydrogenase (short-subunit alcohol dehydrogenase family)
MEECAPGKGRAVAQAIRENMTDHQLLAGKRALVTGGGAGIGAAIVRALAAAGARVCVTDMNGEAAEELAAAIASASPGIPGSSPGTHMALRLDVTNAAETERVFDSAFDAFGGLDIVCANAGISTMNRVVDLTEAEWDANMDVNAKGIFLSDRAAVRRWQKAGAKGVIVNTASMAGKTGAPLLAHYCASKFAVVGFTQALAKEVGGDGIRVNCVCPGYVRTSMQDRELVWEAGLRNMTAAAVRAEYVSLTPLGRIEEPEDVADVVVFLASDLARFMTGEAVCVTGGAWMD